ncbi:MAG: hypothetical protein RLZZ226_599 [Pseudomonadota bacterium]
MTRTPRPSETSMPNVCLVTSVRNEAVHLLEWIAYHRMIGIRHFLIFSNDCDDGTDELLGLLQRTGLVTHVPQEILPGEKPQEKAFRRAWQEFLPAIKPDYVFVADPDEFLNLKCFDTLKDLLAYYDYPLALAIQWRHFGSSGLFFRDTRPTIERFQRASVSDNFHNRQFKTLCRYDRSQIKALTAHRPVLNQSSFNGRYILPGVCRAGVALPQAVREGANAKFIEGSFPVMHSMAQINHYATRSVEEFHIKRNRGNGLLSNAVKAALHYKNDYFIEHDLNELEEPSIVRRLPELKQAQAELLDTLQPGALLAWMERRFADKVQAVPISDSVQTREDYTLIPDGVWTNAAVHPVVCLDTLPARLSDGETFRFSGQLSRPHGQHPLSGLHLVSSGGQSLQAALEVQTDTLAFRFEQATVERGETLCLTARFADDTVRTLARLLVHGTTPTCPIK